MDFIPNLKSSAFETDRSQIGDDDLWDVNANSTTGIEHEVMLIFSPGTKPPVIENLQQLQGNHSQH